MFCLTDLLCGIPIICAKGSVQQIAPIARNLGSLVVLESGSKFYVKERPEEILFKNEKGVDNDQLN